MTFKTRLSVLLVSTPVLAFVLVGGIMGKESAAGQRPFQHLRVFDDVIQLVMNNYVGDVEVDRVMDGAMRGLADGLDPDSAYLNADQVRALEAGEKLPEAGVGIELTRQYYLRVIAARDGSPAAKAGLQSGDYVRAIDGKSTRDMSVFEGTRLLRGEPGTKVVLTIIRGNAADPHEVTLVREKPAGALVTGRLQGNVGIVRIASFENGATEQLRKQIEKLTAGGATSLILDVRGTAEGPLENGIEAARLFVKSGTLVIKAGRDEGTGGSGTKPGPRQPVVAQDGDGAIALPVSLLTTSGTSGAAELFAAALGGNDRAELIGERTLGRAGIQKLVRLPEGRGLWLTYARYLTPDGTAIQGEGLQPDIEVDQPSVDFGAPAPEKDPILEKALERATARAAA